MPFSEPALHVRLLDVAAGPHIVSLYNSLRSVLPEAVWWVTDEALGRIPFPVAPETPFCSEALLHEDLKSERIQEGQNTHKKPPPPGEVYPCCPGYCQGMAAFAYRGTVLGGIGLCHVPEERAELLIDILNLLSGYLDLVSHTLEGNDDLELVRSLWSETISVLDLDTLLRRVMDELLRTLSLDKGLIFLLDEDGMFYVAKSHGINADPLHQQPPPVARYDYGEKINLLLQRGTQCLHKDDPLLVWLESRMPDWSDKEILVVPFFRNEYLIGMFVTPVSPRPTFSPSRHRLLNLLSTGAATALDNALIFKRMHERRLALSTIHTVHRLMGSTRSVEDLLSRAAQQARQLLRSEKCSVMLFNNDRSCLVPRFTWGLAEQEVGSCPVQPGVGLIGWVAETYEAFVYNPGSDNPPPWKDNGERYSNRSYLVVPLIDEDLEGVLMLSGRKERFSPGDREILITLAEQIVIAVHNAAIREGERRININTLRGIANLLERGTPSRPGWTARISALSEKMAKKVSLKEENLENLIFASLLSHSGLLRSVNMFPAQSNSNPRIDRQISCEIIQSLGLPPEVAGIVSHIDERFDGRGEPKGLTGDAIPLASRILQVVTGYIALVEPGMRPNREALSQERALAILKRRAGSVYDPELLEALQEVTESE